MDIVYESPESSSPIITRAVAAGLSGSNFTSYKFDPLQKLGLNIIGSLPQAIAKWIIPRVQGAVALDPNALNDLRVDDLVRARTQDYAALDRKFPAVVMGVGMGGATTHLSLALQAPFLPQAFVMTLKNGSIDGNVHRYLDLSKDLARRITQNNPGMMSIQHYDPIHDGWLVRRVNHLRLKLTELPEGYKRFIRARVVPGGEVIYLEGHARWLRYRLGDRNVFQVGGWGDISAKEFLDGSERIRKYCAQEKISETNWRLDEFPLEEGPESEWGSETGLKESLEEFCREEGFLFREISYKDPNDFSRLAFSAISEQFQQNGIEPSGVLVEIFSQYDPDAVLRYGLLPLWLIFNTTDSLRYLNTMRNSFLPEKPVLFAGLSTFSDTPDLVNWQDWQDCLKGFETVNIGARRSHYPADAHALIHWQHNLQRWGGDRRIPELRAISGQDLSDIAHRIALIREAE